MPALLRLDQKLQDPPRQPSIRRAQQAHRRPAALQKHSLLLRKRYETVEAVILPHPAWPHAAERQVGLADMENTIVHRNAAGQRSSKYFFDAFPAVVEIVQRQRMRPRIH